MTQSKTQTNLRLAIIGMLTFTGIFHILVAALSPASGWAVGLTVFGFIYAGLGYYVRADTNDGSKTGSRNAIIAALVVCTIGLVLGTIRFTQDGGPGAVTIMFGIDALIIAAAIAWLLGARKPS